MKQVTPVIFFQQLSMLVYNKQTNYVFNGIQNEYFASFFLEKLLPIYFNIKYMLTLIFPIKNIRKSNLAKILKHIKKEFFKEFRVSSYICFLQHELSHIKYFILLRYRINIRKIKKLWMRLINTSYKANYIEFKKVNENIREFIIKATAISMTETIFHKAGLNLDNIWKWKDNIVLFKFNVLYKTVLQELVHTDMEFEVQHIQRKLRSIYKNYSIKFSHKYYAVNEVVTTLKKVSRKSCTPLYIAISHTLLIELLPVKIFLAFSTVDWIFYCENLHEAFLRKLFGKFYNIKVSIEKMLKIFSQIVSIHLMAITSILEPEDKLLIETLSKLYNNAFFYFRKMIGVSILIKFCSFYFNVITILQGEFICYKFRKSKYEKLNYHKILRDTFVPQPKFLPPRKWRQSKSRGLFRNYSGGFYWNKQLKLIRLIHYSIIKAQRMILITNKVLNSINRLQATPYQINWMAADNWMYKVEDEEIPFPQDLVARSHYIEKITIVRILRRIQVQINKLKENIKLKTRIQTKISERFFMENFNIYFPLALDHRGRVKPFCWPHYIGPKIIRILLDAPYKYILNIIALKRTVFVRYFKNRERYQEKLFHKLFSYPILSQKFNVYLLEDSYMLRRVLYEMLQYYEYLKAVRLTSITNYNSKILLGQDCTSSVLQIQNILLCNNKYKQALNFIAAGENIGSIYTELITEFIPYVERLVTFTNSTDDPTYILGVSQFLKEIKKLPETTGGNLLTKFFKLNIIQTGYGGTYYGLIIKMHEICDTTEFLTGHLRWVRGITIKCITKYLIQNSTQLSFLKISRLIANLFNKFNFPLTYWSYFKSLNVSEYRAYEYRRIYQNVYMHEIYGIYTHKLRIPTSNFYTILSHKQRNALCANFTQMIDASIVHELAVKLSGRYPLLTIHDAFSTTSTEIEAIRNGVRHFFYDLAITPPLTIKDFFFDEFRKLPLIHNMLFYFFIYLKINISAQCYFKLLNKVIKKIKNKIRDIRHGLEFNTGYKKLFPVQLKQATFVNYT